VLKACIPLVWSQIADGIRQIRVAERRRELFEALADAPQDVIKYVLAKVSY